MPGIGLRFLASTWWTFACLRRSCVQRTLIYTLTSQPIIFTFLTLSVKLTNRKNLCHREAKIWWKV